MVPNAFPCTGAYAVLIMSGLKRVENRSMMPVLSKGRCAMSVSKKFCRAEYDNLVAWLSARKWHDEPKSGTMNGECGTIKWHDEE